MAQTFEEILKPYFHTTAFCEQRELYTIKGHSAVTFLQFKQYACKHVPHKQKMQLDESKA